MGRGSACVKKFLTFTLAGPDVSDVSSIVDQTPLLPIVFS